MTIKKRLDKLEAFQQPKAYPDTIIFVVIGDNGQPVPLNGYSFGDVKIARLSGEADDDLLVRAKAEFFRLNPDATVAVLITYDD